MRQHQLPASIPGVVEFARVDGALASPARAPALLVEAPHGATRREHYDALRSRLRSELPDDLHEFFFVNTDVGSWEYGRRVAERVVAAAPEVSVLVARCLIPRTFIDVNRRVAGGGGALSEGELTAAVPPNVRAPEDHALLVGLHRAYTDAIERAYAEICGRGGLGLIAHTYGPRTLGIERVDDDIVHNLRWAHAPERVETWPLRAPIDLLTRTPDGEELAPPGLADELARRYAALGIEAACNHTYSLHPSSLGHDWSRRYPGQLLCVEARRDLLVERWTWNRAMTIDAGAVDRVAAPLAAAIVERLPRAAVDE